MDQDGIRLSKFLANAGVASRRKADDIIKAGRVKVNSIKVLEPFLTVIFSKDVVTVDNVRINYRIDFKYIALYKPTGYLSDLKDNQDRRLARQLLADKGRLFPVGRLDYTSEGLMLFTNDGEFAQQVMHPRYEVEKEYLVKFKGKLDPLELQRAVEGVLVEGERYAFDRITLESLEGRNAWYRVIIHEGKNRMIRKVGDALCHDVMRLRRIRIGSIHLGSMKPGDSRHLTRKEIAFFLQDPTTLHAEHQFRKPPASIVTSKGYFD